MESIVPRYKIHTALVFAVLFWAISFIATKVALTHMPPLFLVFARLVVSSICFLVWIYLKGSTVRYHGGGWLLNILLLSLFGSGLHYSLQTIGLKYTSASNASIYAVTAPITITIIAVFFLGEKASLKKIIGIFLALIGVLNVIGIETLLAFDLKGHLLGDLLVFSSISMWGLFTVMSKRMTEKMSALDLTMLITIIGALYMAPVGLVDLNTHSISITSIPMEGWAAVLFLGITCSFLATLLYIFALKHSESQKVGVYLYTIPPLTQFFAAIFLGETIGLPLISGSIAVLYGVYLTEKG